ncbi:hypothetical protein TREMEDRAFT_69771 [Tremella mesenterica DSM 1558]|uniref:uncharacterized protein n=1 Tax=Tremella mesenterica (strain ATCC 24925 / CBS 8224 / DSM 1558 / NBRC 9311 / NRRL Y-6157 / RJB 2259-6 / UBC 559-6) TaxID=578456 RepID=UPI0003F49631|nr:uncharacterized protein TREMEDRAFT_69771 [Tremella mesenterica DSM 1558]EIW67289.1 hypothetical protein TREMEDRAFT_69771 [Tremella mesenterica DSM 1558]
MSLGHLLSCFLLFAATVLLLIATLTAPIWHTIGFLTVRNAGVQSVFGTFGYCLSGGPNDGCSNTALGYDIASISGAVSDYTYINNHLDDVTKALILHPIACGLSTITFLTTLISHRTSFLISSFFSISTFIVTFVVMIIDFVLFGMIKYEIRHNTTGTADYSTGVWLVLSSTIVLFFSTFILIFEFFLEMGWGMIMDRSFLKEGLRSLNLL